MSSSRLAVVCSGFAWVLSTFTVGCGGKTGLDSLENDDGGGGSGSGGNSGSGSGSSSSGSGGSSSSGSGSGGSSSSGGGSGGSSSSSGSGSGGSSGSGSSSGGNSSGGGGSLYFEQCVGSTTLCGSMSAYFFGSFFQGVTPQMCAPTTSSGECQFYSNCTTATEGAVAGTVTISGGDLVTSIPLMPDANNDDAYDYAGSGALFSAGQTLSVSASGGVVPAFGPTSVVAPPTPVLTQPAAISGMYTIATSADLPVVWTGGQPGDLFLLEGTDSSGQSYFTCTWDAAAGMATVPQPVLAGLADQPGAFLYYAQIATTNVTVDGYAISVSALPFSGGTASFQ